jgi:hypothetical protein
VSVRLNNQYGKVVNPRFSTQPDVKTYELSLPPDIHDHSSLHVSMDGAVVSIMLQSGRVGNEVVVSQDQVPLDVLLGLGTSSNAASTHTIAFQGTGASVTFAATYTASNSACDIFTTGGAVRVVGENFGLKDPNAHQFVSFGPSGDFISTRKIKAGTADSTTVYHEIEVILPPGIGVGHEMTVFTCRGQSAQDPSCVNEYSVSNTVLLDYADPHIRSLNTLETIVDGVVQPDFVDIEIVGSNFAQGGTVFVMNKFGDTWLEATVRVNEDGILSSSLSFHCFLSWPTFLSSFYISFGSRSRMPSTTTRHH